MDLNIMPKSQKGHKFILCAIDEVTNYLITAPIYQSKSEGNRKGFDRECNIKILCSKLYNYGFEQCIYVHTHELLVQKVCY